MNGERKWDTHTYILPLKYSVIKKEILHLCDNMDEPAGCSAAWNKPDGEGQLSYDLEKKVKLRETESGMMVSRSWG